MAAPIIAGSLAATAAAHGAKARNLYKMTLTGFYYAITML